MIINVLGVVLSRRDLREADSLAVLYTENLGKIPVKFIGVKKPGRKLKALCEPLVWGEYRLYLSPRSDMAKAIGGRIIDSFPAIRRNFSRIMEAMECCERLASLVPERSPNERKYHLLVQALAALEAGESPWLGVAYGLQLLELSGYGLGQTPLPAPDQPVWRALHDSELDDLRGVPWRRDLAGKFRGILEGHIEAQIGRPLKSRLFAENINGAVAA